MRWVTLNVEVDGPWAERLADALLERGALSVEITDADVGTGHEAPLFGNPGEVAPMSFMTYQETRPWAKAIKTAVLSKKMPPWYADPKYGHFQNERRLSSLRWG